MTERPWSKFYWPDWRADPRLRMCSLAARGLWVEMLALAHEAEPYGHVLVNGVQPSARQLAGLVGSTEREVAALLGQLEEAGVFSRTVDGVVYSRRMVRDAEKLEADKAHGKRGGNPMLKAAANGGVNPQDKAHKPEARSQEPEKEETRAMRADFDVWYQAYPRKVAPPLALKAYLKARKKADAATLLAGIERYRKLKPDYADWAHPATWLNEERWLDQPDSLPSNGHADPDAERKTRARAISKGMHIPSISDHEVRRMVAAGYLTSEQAVAAGYEP